MSPSRRPCIEVDKSRNSFTDWKPKTFRSPGLSPTSTLEEIPCSPVHDPIEIFVSTVRSKHGGTQEVYRANLMLLRSLISNGHISKPSIIWDNDCICKIYGIRLDGESRIVYDKAQRRQDSAVRDEPKAMSVNLSSLREAVLREKRWA